MKYRNRQQATQYLRDVWGLPCGRAFLARQAVTASGPLFRYSGRYPVYTEADLDDWAAARLSAPVRSPSEAALLNALPDGPLGPATREARHKAAAPKTPRRPGRPRREKGSAQTEPFKTDACA
jgi:hypothetical protein